jgi:hypothetical protein
MKLLIPIAFVILVIACNYQSKESLSDNIPKGDSLKHKRTKLSIEQINELDSVNIKFQIRGFFYASSSIKNKEKSRGQANSSNLPREIGPDFPRNGLYFLVNMEEYVPIDTNYLGYKIYLVNTTDSIVILSAQDSRLDVIPEARSKNGEWKPIGYNPSSWCGNSYHKIKLDKNEYWEFAIPAFKGSFKTTMRYVLRIDDTLKVTSEEIITSINPEQFNTENKQGHMVEGLMDPYYD